MSSISKGHGRLVLLFLIAVVLPSLVLVIFTLRMIGQEQELAGKRLVDERRRLAAEIGRFLLVRLESIRLQETSSTTPLVLTREYSNSEVVLVCRVAGDKLLLPWEWSAGFEESRRILSQSHYSQDIVRGEQEEFGMRNPEAAAAWYRRSLGKGREPLQQAYALLLLARALMKAGQAGQASECYRSIIAMPTSGADEYGISLALYACRGLVGSGASPAEAVKVLTIELRRNRWHSPPEAFLLKDLLDRVIRTETEPAVHSAAQACRQEVVGYIALMEQALALQRNYPALRLVLSKGDGARAPLPTWALYGDNPWLVSITHNPPESTGLLLAVHAGRILNSSCSALGLNQNQTGNPQFVTSSEPEGTYLGPGFSGVRITFSDAGSAAAPASQSARRLLYLLPMLVVLSVTLFGSYLLWRDVRRELRMAEMRSQFVSSVSHELKTPLTAIRMFAETLSLGRSKNPDIQREYLETIVNESERLTRLLNNVLDFSKIEMGRMVYRPKPASLADIVRAAARTIQYPLGQQGFSLNMRIEDGMPDLCVDRDAIEQATLNLLSNAMKYSGDARAIDLCLFRAGVDAVIRVTDHGIGIDPRDQTKIFEKFYRVNSPENTRITGTGLGLALVAHIVKAHGGRIEVASMPGRGSTFSIYLPLEREP